MVASAALIGMELALSQHMQLVRELSPLEAGLLLLPLPLASAVGELASSNFNHIMRAIESSFPSIPLT